MLIHRYLTSKTVHCVKSKSDSESHTHQQPINDIPLWEKKTSAKTKKQFKTLNIRLNLSINGTKGHWEPLKKKENSLNKVLFY